MDEYFWLAVSFAAFWVLAGKPIFKAIYSFLKNAQNLIAQKIKDAQNIYAEAQEALEEAKALQNELKNSLKYISDKAKEAIDYDLNTRTKSLEKLIEIKNKQAENQIEREVNLFKAEMLNLLELNLNAKFIFHFQKNKKQAEEFTDLMLKG